MATRHFPNVQIPAFVRPVGVTSEKHLVESGGGFRRTILQCAFIKLTYALQMLHQKNIRFS